MASTRTPSTQANFQTAKFPPMTGTPPMFTSISRNEEQSETRNKANSFTRHRRDPRRMGPSGSRDRFLPCRTGNWNRRRRVGRHLQCDGRDTRRTLGVLRDEARTDLDGSGSSHHETLQSKGLHPMARKDAGELLVRVLGQLRRATSEVLSLGVRELHTRAFCTGRTSGETDKEATRPLGQEHPRRVRLPKTRHGR